MLLSAVSDVSTVTTALTTGMSTIASDAMGALAAALPVALPIAGAGIVISLGVKWFKRIANK